MKYRNENPNVKYAVEFTLGFFYAHGSPKGIKEGMQDDELSMGLLYIRLF